MATPVMSASAAEPSTVADAAIATTTSAADNNRNPDVPDDAPHAFIPLEANPALMTGLVHELGLSPALEIHDVFSLDDPEMLSFIPRPAMALLLVFPVSKTYEEHRLAEDKDRQMYTGSGPSEPVVWFRQTIRNACGVMGLLHATTNGPARNFIQEGSSLDKLLQRALPLAPKERSRLLEVDENLASAHAKAAKGGDTAAPDATDNVDLHYVCFVKTDDNTFWELDGRRKGPISRGVLAAGDDVLSEEALRLGPRAFLGRDGAADLRFSCVALAPALD